MNFGMKIETMLEDDQTEKFGAEYQQMLRDSLYKDNEAPKSEDQYKTFFRLLGADQYQKSLEHLEAKSFVDSKGHHQNILQTKHAITFILPDNPNSKKFVVAIENYGENLYEITFENNRFLYSFRLRGNLYMFTYIYSSATNVQAFVYSSFSYPDVHIDFYTAGQQVNYKNILRNTELASKRQRQHSDKEIRMITDKVFLDVDDIRSIYKRREAVQYWGKKDN